MVTTVKEELAFCRDDFTTYISWIKYCRGEKLREFDFVDKDKYTMWFLLELELVNFAVVMVDGLKGSGKSLFGAWVADRNNKLFGKGVTTNCKLKDTFGQFNLVDEKIFINEWIKLTELADRDDSNDLIRNIVELTKYSMFYNRTILIDEARKWIWKRRPHSRMLQYIGELIDVSRHNHDVILFSCANLEHIADVQTIWENRTHEVNCSFNTTYRGYATYSIKHRNTNKIRWLHLEASKYAALWESESLVGMSKPLSKKTLTDAFKQMEINQLMEVGNGNIKQSL